MLKNSKLIGETDNNYTIQLPSGHKMNLKKDGLHEKAQQIIKSLKGQQVKSYQDGGEVLADEIDLLKNDPEMLEYTNLVNRSPARMAEVDMDDSDIPATSSITMPKSNIANDSGVETMPFLTPSAEPAAIPSGVPSGIPSATPQAAEQAAESEPTTDQMSATPSTQSAAQMTTGMTGQPSSVDALGRYKTALQDIGRIKEAEGQATYNAINEAQAKIDLLPTANEILNKYEKPNQDLLKAYQEKNIDPKQYFKNRTTGQKIMSGIGMLLSGFGAGASGQENMAFKMLQKAVQDDIEAQKFDKDEKLNLYKMNLNQMKTEMEANLTTQTQMWTGVKYELQKAAANAYSKMGKAEALKAIALVDNEIQNRKDEMALLQPTKESTGGFAADTQQGYINHMNALQMKGIQSKNPQMIDLAKKMESKLIPNKGVASIPLSEKDRQQDRSLQNSYDLYTRALAFITENARTLPLTVANSKAQRMFTELMFAEKTNNELGVPSGKDIEMLETLVANPGSWFSENAKTTLKEGKFATMDKQNRLYKTLGVQFFNDPTNPKRIKVQNSKPPYDIQEVLPQDLEHAIKDQYYVK